MPTLSRISLGFLTIAVLTAGCRSRSSSTVAQDTQSSYDIAGEEAANAAANGLWTSSVPARNSALYNDSCTYVVTYAAATGELKYAFKSRGSALGTNLEVAIGRNSSKPTYDISHITNWSILVGHGILFTAFLGPFGLPIVALTAATAPGPPPPPGNLVTTTMDQVSYQLRDLTDADTAMASMLAAQPRQTSGAKYLKTIFARKVRQAQLRKDIADYAAALKDVQHVLGFDNRSASQAAVSFLALSAVDVNHLGADGAPLMTLNLPGEVYKLTLYPGLELGISYAAATSQALAWSFKNTFTRTQLVGPKQPPCLADCLKTPAGAEQWDVNNQHNFNQALAALRGTLLGLTSNMVDLNNLPDYENLLNLLARVSDTQADILPQAEPKPQRLASFIDQAAADRAVDEGKLDLLPTMTAAEIDAALQEAFQPAEATNSAAASSDADRPDAAAGEAQSSSTDTAANRSGSDGTSTSRR